MTKENFKNITGLELPELEVFTSLKEPQLYHYYEPEPGLFIAETPNVIQRALSAGYIPESMLCEDSMEETAEKILKDYPQVPVYICPTEAMKDITGYFLTHGMLCCMRRKKMPEASAVLQEISRQDTQHIRIAVLEDVVNPTNTGAIIRSAAALGIDAVFLTEGCADPLQRRCARVSMGTVFQIPWTWVKSDWISLLHSEGYSIAALALEDESISVSDPVLKQERKIALVLGSEGYGLKPSTIAAADNKVLIPMQHGVDSLNVAAASAVAFWEIAQFV